MRQDFDPTMVRGPETALRALNKFARWSVLALLATGCVAKIEIPIPDAPTFASFDAVMGMGDTFTIKGFAPADSRVRFYENAQCAGVPLAVASGADLAKGVSINATRSRMTIYATTQIGQSRLSPCTSKPYTYVRVAWVWADGEDRPTFSYSYGVKGVSAASNYLRPRGQPSVFQTADGVRWYYGGNGPWYGDLSDLWSFDPKSNLWTWMSGPTATQDGGSYGTSGVASSTNIPPSRAANAGWLGDDGTYYAYGGFSSSPGGGALGDLWKYDTRVNEWTWVGGSATRDLTPTFGSLKVPSTSNYPGARMNGFTWKDSRGRLWMLGGQRTGGLGNDFWRLDLQTSEWTFMGGSTSVDVAGSYAALGVPSTSAVPGARILGCSTTAADGTMWLFGGRGYDANGTYGHLSDLWSYNSEAETWTWRSGVKVANQPGIYGEQGVGTSAARPGARRANACWTDSLGRLWVFGGEGYGESGAGTLGDLWFYDPKTDVWTWWTGPKQPNQFGNYGQKNIASLSNYPGTRQDLAEPVIDEQGRVWLVGGYGYSAAGSPAPLGDVWYIQMP